VERGTPAPLSDASDCPRSTRSSSNVRVPPKAAGGCRTPKPNGFSFALEPREASCSAAALRRFGLCCRRDRARMKSPHIKGCIGAEPNRPRHPSQPLQPLHPTASPLLISERGCVPALRGPPAAATLTPTHALGPLTASLPHLFMSRPEFMRTPHSPKNPAATGALHTVALQPDCSSVSERGCVRRTTRSKRPVFPPSLSVLRPPSSVLPPSLCELRRTGRPLSSVVCPSVLTASQ
jgi:hypothetical protein